jgi:hypothetical protein
MGQAWEGRVELTAAMRSPIQRMTGTAMELPQAL